MQVQPPAGPVSPPALACRLAFRTLKTLRAPPASRTHAKSRGASGLAPRTQLSLPPERPCREDGAAQQKVGPLRWPGIEPGSTAWKAAMLTTIPPTLHSPSSAVRRPRARPRILFPPPPPPHPCPDAPSAGGSAPPPAPPAAARRPMRASATPLRGPPARRPCGPPALRSPPRPANASALSPGGQRGARSFPHPAGQKSPSPPGAGRRHFPRRLGDTGPSCLHASRRCAEPHGGGVASLGAH